MTTLVTKENQEGKTHFYHSTEITKRGERIHCKRNGKTKIWKTRTLEFKIPVKYGLYDYFYITQDNCKFWTID